MTPLEIILHFYQRKLEQSLDQAMLMILPTM